MFGSGEMVVVLAVIMLLFGSSQIPKMAKNLGLAQKELKDALGGDEEKDEAKDDGTAPATTSATAAKLEQTEATETLAPPVALGSTETNSREADTSHVHSSPDA